LIDFTKIDFIEIDFIEIDFIEIDLTEGLAQGILPSVSHGSAEEELCSSGRS
jgi:hypothetical protein